jgi:hypothetical protein
MIADQTSGPMSDSWCWLRDEKDRRRRTADVWKSVSQQAAKQVSM